MSIRENVEAVLGTIRDFARRAGRSGEEIKLVGVTKTVSPEHMLQAADAGILIFGENRLQEAVRKQDAVPWPEHIQWHFIGHLQRNKVRPAIQRFQMIQSVDSIPLAKTLDKHCGSERTPMPVLMEVNLGEEQTKGGFRPDEIEDRAREIQSLEHLRLEGLMAIPPYVENPEDSRPYFRRMRTLFEHLGSRGFSLSELSMGMSHDFAVAVEEGATMVRVGTAIFGERPLA